MAKNPIGYGIEIPENSFGIGVNETQTSGTVGTFQQEDVGAGGSGPGGFRNYPIKRPPGGGTTCSCAGPGSSSVKQVQVLRNNLYNIK